MHLLTFVPIPDTQMTAGPADTQPLEDAPLCAACGEAVPAMAAVIYHGLVYHPGCVLPTTRREPPAGRAADRETRQPGGSAPA